MAAIASQLAQFHSPSAGAATIYSASYQTEITRLVIANCHSATAVYSLFHDDDGADYTRGTALQYETEIGPNRSVAFIAEAAGAGITVKKTGTIGFRSDRTAGFTVSIYGITEGVR